MLGPGVSASVALASPVAGPWAKSWCVPVLRVVVVLGVVLLLSGNESEMSHT